VPGSAVLSMIRTEMPSRVNQSASTRQVGPAPTIQDRAGRSSLPLLLSLPSAAPMPLWVTVQYH